MIQRKRWIGFGILFLSGLPSTALSQSETRVDFTRDIRSILSNRCFACHGPDEAKRESGLQLDDREKATAPADSGQVAIVPNDADASELLKRVRSNDPDFRMPPPSFGEPLSEKEVDLLSQWINQGAPYAKHWSFVPPIHHPLPTLKDEFAIQWCRNPIDYFVWDKMVERGLVPESEASRGEILRRVSLDLTGLPPTVEELQQFLDNPSWEAYESNVDRLLASPRFGEHWARKWLDLARYADSAGYADDPARTIWGYRDWVVRAMNQDMPFDQFTIEQLAGDLLPSPTDDQWIATAFHRNTMTNNEGGTNDEEFRNVAIVDRVNTTMAVWTGVTMACAQCHTHKFDPLSQKEYFQVFDIFNQSEDADKRDESPLLHWITPEQKERKQAIEAKLVQIESEMENPATDLQVLQTSWEERIRKPADFAIAIPNKVESEAKFDWSQSADGHVFVPTQGTRDNIVVEWDAPAEFKPQQLTVLELETIPDDRNPGRGAGNASDGSFVLSRVQLTATPVDSQPTLGRFVRVEIPGREKILSLAEVQVLSFGKNIAVDGKSTQSSDYSDAVASRAIDGKTNGDYEKKSTSHTAISDNPWWEVDLGGMRSIDAVHLYNRTDNDLHTRLSGAVVSILSEDRSVMWKQTIQQGKARPEKWEISDAFVISFDQAVADAQADGFRAANVLDNDPKTGWSVRDKIDQTHQLRLLTKLASNLETASKDAPTWDARRWKFRLELESKSQQATHVLCSFRVRTSFDAAAHEQARVDLSTRAILQKSRAERTLDENRKLSSFFVRRFAPENHPLRSAYEKWLAQRDAITPTTSIPILRDLPADKRRATFVQLRGNYRVLGEKVQAGFPNALHSPQTVEERPNRLSLAKWLMQSDNPLTPRVIANRTWESLFGLGLVRTSEEFGSQGDLPSHPELLDWLATEMVQQKWNSKQFLRMMVTSATYRQRSSVTLRKMELDPENVFLSRGPRFRLSAEEVRDQALAIAGLLSHTMYGEPVKPRQPKMGLTAAFGSNTDWETSDGENKFRRGLYTTWRRSNPYPSMATFDAPNREVCTLKRDRTNTPLQALVTLNDPVFVEAAQGLARRIVLHEAKDSVVEDKIAYAFQLTTSRTPIPAEMASLIQLYEKSYQHFQSLAPSIAVKLATEPIGPLPPEASAVELAAWTTLANVILNLDEVLMKR